MGVASGFVADRAQTKTLRGVETCRFQPSVIPGQRLGLAVFKKQLAVVAALQSFIDQAFDLVSVEAGAREQVFFGFAGVAHVVSVSYCRGEKYCRGERSNLS